MRRRHRFKRIGSWAERKRATMHAMAHPPECAIYTWCPESPNHLPCDCGKKSAGG
jgi:hypothetical protein